jgi:hypothetical protein
LVSLAKADRNAASVAFGAYIAISVTQNIEKYKANERTSGLAGEREDLAGIVTQIIGH